MFHLLLVLSTLANAQTQPVWSEVKPYFQAFCVNCHTTYLRDDAVEANRAAMYEKMKWLETGAAPTDRDMPAKQGPFREQIQKSNNAEKRKAMLSYLKPAGSQNNNSSTYPVERLTVPSGYKIALYAKVPGARSLALAADGTLFASTGGLGSSGNW